jgi:hypothetical protein
MPPLTGDFGKLARWERALGQLATGKAAFDIADEMADTALGLVAESFGRESDPFGRRWAPKKTPNGKAILRGETNRLVQWRKSFVNQYGYAITSRATYAKFHQRGTFNKDGSQRMVARPMAPTGRRLPPKWSSEFRGVYLRRMHALLTK